MEQQRINKARKPIGLWLTTDEIVTRLSERMGIAKTEIIHMAVVEMAKQHLKDEEEGNE